MELSEHEVLPKKNSRTGLRLLVKFLSFHFNFVSFFVQGFT